MRAGIGQRYDALVVAQHAPDRFLVRVEQRAGEKGVEPFAQAQVKHEIERIFFSRARQKVDRLSIEVPMLSLRGLSDEHFFPVAVEQAPLRHGELRFYALAKGLRSECALQLWPLHLHER